MMKNNFKPFLIAVIFGFSSLGLVACSDDAEEDVEHDSENTVNLSKSQVVTQSGNSLTTGSAVIEYHADDKELHADVTFSGNDEVTNLHIHKGFAGAPASADSIVRTLEEDATTKDWSIMEGEENFTQDEIAALEMGEYYLNAHFADGSTIRGQITVNNVKVITAPLTLSAGVDASTTTDGFSAITLDKVTGEIFAGYVVVTNIDTTINAINNIHLHIENNDDSTDRLITLVDSAITDENFYNIDAANEDALNVESLENAEHGQWYYNIHTDDNGIGEVRGVLTGLDHGH